MTLFHKSNFALLFFEKYSTMSNLFLNKVTNSLQVDENVVPRKKCCSTKILSIKQLHFYPLNNLVPSTSFRNKRKAKIA